MVLAFLAASVAVFLTLVAVEGAFFLVTRCLAGAEAASSGNLRGLEVPSAARVTAIVERTAGYFDLLAWPLQRYAYCENSREGVGASGEEFKKPSRLAIKANKAYEMVAALLLYFESIGHVESSIGREIQKGSGIKTSKSKAAAKILLTFSTNGNASRYAT